MGHLTHFIFRGLLGALLLTSAACESRCEQMCSRTVECLPGEVNRLIPDFLGVACQWKHGPRFADDTCVAACEAEYDQVSYGLVDDVDRCLDCRLEAGGDTGEGCSNYNDMYGACEVYCEEPGVEQFIEGFRSKSDLMSDLDCQ